MMFALKRTFATTARRTLPDSQRRAGSSGSSGSNVFKALLDSVDTAHQARVSKPPILEGLIKKFEEGTTYDPFDFSLAKQQLEKRLARESFSKKTFDTKKVNPLDFYTNPRYLSEYLSATGRIQPRDVTKLSLKNQKRLAKAVKRARSAGLLSSVHKDSTNLIFKKYV
jgi:small subunit ribosomal protein S18